MASTRLAEIIEDEDVVSDRQHIGVVDMESSVRNMSGKVRKGAFRMTPTENQMENEFMHLALRKQLSYR